MSTTDNGGVRTIDTSEYGDCTVHESIDDSDEYPKRMDVVVTSKGRHYVVLRQYIGYHGEPRYKLRTKYTQPVIYPSAEQLREWVNDYGWVVIQR